MTQKHICNMTRKEFLEVQPREDWRKPVFCNSLVLIPRRKKHESGYRCIIAVACKDGYPVCQVTTSSDVIKAWSLDYINHDNPVYTNDIAMRWNIDCLPKSGLFNLWSDKSLEVGVAISSLEVIGNREENR